MYSLLIKGATVIDPSQGLHAVSDIAVQDGKIARIAPDIPAQEASRVVQVKGRIVTPPQGRGMGYDPAVYRVV